MSAHPRIVFRAMCRVPTAQAPAADAGPPVLTDVVAGPPVLWEVADCEFQDRLPFVPAVGMHLQISPHAPFMRVREVKWSCHAPGLLCCYMAEADTPEAMPWSTDLRPDGWSVTA